MHLSPQSSKGPRLLDATLRGNQIILQFDDAIADTLPKLANFTMINGSREITFVDAEVIASAGRVILTAAGNIDATSSVTLSYFDLGSDQLNGVIESRSGDDLASFSDFAINNQSFQANTLGIDEGDFDGNTITLSLNAQISKALPSIKRFSVKAGKKKQKLIGVDTDPSEGTITLTTKKSVGSYESILVSYKDLAGDQNSSVIEDVTGNDMKTIKGFEILNSGYEEIPPELISAELNDNKLTLGFDSIINNTKLSKNRFKVKANGKKLRVSSATVEGEGESFVTLTVAGKRGQILDSQTEVTVSYSDPKGDQNKSVIEDLFGNDLLSTNSFFVEIV